MSATKRPGRAKMNSWLAFQLGGIKVCPFNPVDLHKLTTNARDADRKLAQLTSIAAHMGWHIDASLDVAWEEIQAYEQKWAPTTEATE